MTPEQVASLYESFGDEKLACAGLLGPLETADLIVVECFGHPRVRRERQGAGETRPPPPRSRRAEVGRGLLRVLVTRGDTIARMDRRSRATALWLMLLALGGLLAGHLASYFVVAPDAHERAALLAGTGHGQHGAFATLALAATLAGVIGIFMDRLRARRGRGALTLSRTRLASILWAVQTTGFAALETWERGHGFFGVAELLHEPAFLVGLAAQALVALVATALVLLVRATVDALLRLLAAPRDAAGTPVSFPRTQSRARASVARSAWNLRGPPAAAASRS